MTRAKSSGRHLLRYVRGHVFIQRQPPRGLLNRRGPISFGSCANSFSKKEPAKYCSSIAARSGSRATRPRFHPCTASTATRLAQAQLSHQCFDSVAFCEAIWSGDAASISESSRRRDLYHMDWARFISSSNSRGQHPDRPDLVEMAQSHQTIETAGVRNSSFALY